MVGCGLTVSIRRVVVEYAARGAVEATHHHEVALVLGLPAETLLAHWEEAAVFDGQRAELTGERHGIDQDDGHVALLHVSLELLDGHRAVQEGKGTAQGLFILSVRPWEVGQGLT